VADSVWRRALKRAGQSPVPWQVAGRISGAFMRVVRRTSSFTVEPGNPFAYYAAEAPFILTMWHGQQFMIGFLMQPGARMRGLTSKSNDGEISATFLDSFGIEVIRGSGGRNRERTVEKGGVRAFLALKKSLDEGVSVGTVADIPNTVRRRCGPGVVSLARASGRPVVPLGFATSRWIELNTWDRATIHLPFSRGACAVGAPIAVPRDADDTMMEQKRLEIEQGLNTVTDRAYAMVGKRRDWQD
jgi:lysophospholipid acyltransferase (LPLAT)-like uncharacterized protein